jgi:hypothetical protein
MIEGIDNECTRQTKDGFRALKGVQRWQHSNGCGWQAKARK